MPRCSNASPALAEVTRCMTSSRSLAFYAQGTRVNLFCVHQANSVGGIDLSQKQREKKSLAISKVGLSRGTWALTLPFCPVWAELTGPQTCDHSLGHILASFRARTIRTETWAVKSKARGGKNRFMRSVSDKPQQAQVMRL